MSQALQCWCGNTELVSFSLEYLKCSICKTLVAAQIPEPNIAKVTDDEKDFYGREYWFSHQENDLGLSNIRIRSRTDLPERCLHWLRTLLKYKLPPAKVLELGSAHGGFVAILRWAGFDATGLELSPWVVDFARRTFSIPMLLGPVEEQAIEPGSLDVIALMDVLEHLPDPIVTICHCMNLLKPNGILLIQTPCLPENKSYEQMKEENDSFLLLLKEEEHLYLFSKHSIIDFLNRLGAKYFEFEPAIFSHYDMFLVVSREPLSSYTTEEIENALIATSAGRLIQAMLDLDGQNNSLRKKYEESEADREARLKVIEDLGRRLEESEAGDRTARLERVSVGGWRRLKQTVQHRLMKLRQFMQSLHL